MVSLWPWRGDPSSTASFEKTLATLSTKISTTQAKIEKLRMSSRRVRVLWTLYVSFAYVVYAILEILVIGYQKMGALEWTGMAGGPVIIYLVRTLLGAYYNFRIDSLSARLKEHQAERAKTIQKLKDATKYDSTLQLLEKYGGAEAKPKPKKPASGDGGPDGKKGPRHSLGPSTPSGGRVGAGMPPPPTANIVRGPGSRAGTPMGTPQRPMLPPSSPSGGPASAPGSPPPLQPGAEFAPNAFAQLGGPLPPAYTASNNPNYGAPDAAAGPHWYDRILDLLLGEDETLARNRVVLLCASCRLVNGQAPPGTRDLADVGRWRCMGCGAVNGVERPAEEAEEVVRDVLEGARREARREAGVERGEEDGGGKEMEKGVGKGKGKKAARGMIVESSEDEASDDGPDEDIAESVVVVPDNETTGVEPVVGDGAKKRKGKGRK